MRASPSGQVHHCRRQLFGHPTKIQVEVAITRPKRVILLPFPRYQPKMRCAASTRPSVNPAIATSPIAPTINGFKPCLERTLKLVRKPTPANVSKNAQRDKLASEPICSFEKNAKVASVEIRRKPSTNLGNFCQRNFALFPTA